MTIMAAPTTVQLTQAPLEEELANHAARLARRNLALEDFAALVAHDVRSALLSALRCDEPRNGLALALELVESIIDAARAERAHGETGSVAACARRAMEDLGASGASLAVAPCGPFPLPSAALRVVMRNLFANAVAAGATWMHVSTREGNACHSLIVDDDGSGLASAQPYDAGAGLGLRLCDRLLGRLDASLKLTSGRSGGTRAVIVAHRAVS